MTGSTALWRHSNLLRYFLKAPDVEAYFDAASMNLLFDLEQFATNEVLERSLDVRGERTAVLAVWRAFKFRSVQLGCVVR